MFAVAAVVVCHGGSGTVYGALAAGIPLVVVPSFADQFANGRLVERHGLGEVIVPASTDGRGAIAASDLPRIGDAIRTVLTGDSHRARAASFRREQSRGITPREVLAHLGG